jgi:quercetin dioxygenase-like cupin family protein
MRRSVWAIVVGTFAAAGLTLAQHGDHREGGVKTLSRRDITEKVDGKTAKATTVEVTFGPDEASAAHRHPGPAFGYILEGEYEWAIDDNPVRTLKAGDTFYEPTGCLHRVSRNASKTARARIVAVVLHPADVTEIVIPEKGAKKE